jgi:hypothetical protein
VYLILVYMYLTGRAMAGIKGTGEGANAIARRQGDAGKGATAARRPFADVAARLIAGLCFSHGSRCVCLLSADPLLLLPACGWPAPPIRVTHAVQAEVARRCETRH